MSAFTTMKATKTELIILNNWRLYYRVLLFSELCFSSGQGIQPVYLEYNHDHLVRQSSTTLNWPLQDKPDATSFKIWKRYVKLCFMNTETKRIKQLGSWNVSEVIRTSPRHGYYLQTSKEIFIPIGDDKYNKHQAFEVRRTSGRYYPNQVKVNGCNLPKGVIPADFYEYHDSVLFKYAASNPTIKEQKQLYHAKWSNEILHHLIIEDMPTLQQALLDPKGKVNIVSDGGVHDYNSNYGVVIAFKSSIVATNKGKIYSVPFHESSYRSEMFGMLAATVSLRYIIEHHKMTMAPNKQLYFYCDNKSVVKLINLRLETRRTVNQHRYPDVDIEQQLIYELHQLQEKGCMIIIQHVKGHQDTADNRSMTIEEALNVEADELTHVARKLPDIKVYHKFPTNKVNLKINNQYINSHYPKMVNLAFHSMALREYYAMKHGWSTKIIDSLWWPVYFQSLAKLTDSDKLRIQKFVNNRMPTLHREQKYYNKTTSTGYCKQCRLYNENEDHIIRCRIPSRQKIRDEWRKEFTTYLSESHTPPAIRDALCHGFFNWLESGRNTLGIPSLPTRSPEVMTAYQSQEHIGWHHFTRGRVIIEWGNLINKHVAKQKKYTFNAEQWGTRLISIHWKYILKIWEVRNNEVNGETLVQSNIIRRQNMIEEIIHIQSTHTDLPVTVRQLIARNTTSLRSMSTSSISAYLYGAKLVAEAARKYGRNLDQQTLDKFIESRQQARSTRRKKKRNEKVASAIPVTIVATT
jgi:ribonuclease HI